MIIPKRSMLVRRLRAAVPAVVFCALALYAAWPWLPLSAHGKPPRTIVLYGFSILGEAVNEGVFPAFQEEWRSQTGEHVELVSSFAGSGTVTNQLIMGVPAHLAILSLELDAERLAMAGLTPPQSWRELPRQGVVNRSPFIILVRPGNPKKIHDFIDLARPGIGVIHPDPMTSGGAAWAILAEYGAAARRHPDRLDAGHDLLLGVWRNVVAQASSARAARTQFENGFGDALITYEQEAVWDKARGRLKLDTVYPARTVMSEHTLVVFDRNIAPAERDLVDGFVAFLWTEKAQRIFIEYGFRSVDDRLNDANPAFGRIDDPFGVEDLGGWTRAKREIIDAVWKDRILKELGR
ncbi:MAG: substrate-binding domain-containing protein [Syntrophobacteraceae bacterium]